MTKAANLEPVFTPFTIVVDTREQQPYTFQNLACDAKGKYRPVIVETERKSLETGDYSVKGLEHFVTVERKSVADAYHTFVTDERERFERELERMTKMPYPLVVLEGSWGTLLHPDTPKNVHSQGNRKAFFRSIIAWQARYRIPFETCEGRAFAERYTFRFLERVWTDSQDNRFSPMFSRGFS